MKINEDGDIAAIKAALLEYSKNSQASKGKIISQHAVDEEKREVLFNEIYNGNSAMDNHIGNCFPHYIKVSLDAAAAPGGALGGLTQTPRPQPAPKPPRCCRTARWRRSSPFATQTISPGGRSLPRPGARPSSPSSQRSTRRRSTRSEVHR